MKYLTWMLAGLCLSAQSAELPDNLWVQAKGWEGLKLHAGAMALQLPAYPGSEETRVVPFPVFNGTYKGRLDFGASRFGVGGGFSYRFWNEGPFHWGVGGDGVEPRLESNARGLAGMGDRPLGLFLTSTLAFEKGPLFTGLTFRQALRDGKGLGIAAHAALALPLGRRWILESRIGLNIYDPTSMAYEFGVNKDQAARRAELITAGDTRLHVGEAREFHPGGGPAMMQTSVALGYAMDDHWRLGLTVLRQEVEGEARHSPLVRRPGGWGTVLGFSYQL